MNSFDKFLLLASLSFFFTCFAISLISLRGPGAPDSYIYTPPAIEPEQKQPIESAKRQYDILPQSVLHYPLDQKTDEDGGTVSCYLEDEYKTLINDMTADHYRRAASGKIGDDDIAVYTQENGNFTVFATGPDSFGQTESCIVAEGTGWTSSP